MKHVCYFRHALALDERRVKFLPEYAYGGTSLPPSVTEKRVDASLIDHKPNHDDNNAPSSDGDGTTANNELSEDTPPVDNEATYGQSQARMKSKEKTPGKPPHTMEVWFAGTHSDMYVKAPLYFYIAGAALVIL